ncbi:hypothetical protein COU57_02840 [Candidatus Pacearchaeota archaeon CG10_big_fil_rev_8_21_14_0_10_32_14]|nr:MAG: hypothetical protein COU57_02840 [Candidatus Pacearchaeota archaeon CG10_big_fil_rev_8_21_14_0_10_32_14]
MFERGFNRKAILIIGLIVILLIVAVYFTFFYSYKCKSLACFKEHQRRCNLISSKTIYTNDGDEATWFYHIRGQVKDECKIFVELVQLKKGEASFTQLEGKSMDCYVPIGSDISPESDITECHGKLKEGLQEEMIKKLHKYIVSNLGDISEELQKPL